MTKQHILDEIKRTAKANGGLPVGLRKFRSITGIKDNDWLGKHWVRWSEAIEEAGLLSTNSFAVGYDEEFMLKSLVSLIKELHHFPVRAEMKMKRLKDDSFPGEKAFRQFGYKGDLVGRIIKFCKEHGGYDDVIAICEPLCSSEPPAEDNTRDEFEIGFVYLLKSGKHYKIGRSNAAGRRERELQIQLPEAANHVHVIRTDDPVGIEAYWHNRFAAKRVRKEAEWFNLDSSDIKAFRRRTFM
jgi:hypothetical protein